MLLNIRSLLTRRKVLSFVALSSLILSSFCTWILLTANKLNIEHRTSGGRQQSLIKRLEQSKSVVGNRNTRNTSFRDRQNYIFEEERLKILENQQRAHNAMDEKARVGASMDYEHEPSLAERQLSYERELQRMGVPVVAGLGPEVPHIPRQRLVHLDLKGAPPKLSFLKKLIPSLKSLGATGLLIEYEDMFPYIGGLRNISARNAYLADELKDFLRFAAVQGLTVMPLIQSFGHMEFVLKQKEFQHLREIPESPHAICPSREQSVLVVKEMLTQVIEFHLDALTSLGDSSYDDVSVAPDLSKAFHHIHIGCDEVYLMGSCHLCAQHLQKELFLTHVTTVAHFVRTKWPQLKVIIWDDMLRQMSVSEMQKSQIGVYADPMIWVYGGDIYKFISPNLWDIYSKVFATAWAASAFKGASGESRLIPPLQQHLENNMRWLAIIAKEGERFSKGFQGLALTGWQRYDHFAGLCETLPTAMPSLIASLSTVAKGYFSTDPKQNAIHHILQCGDLCCHFGRSGHMWIDLNPNSHTHQLFSMCSYIGSQLYKYSLRLYEKLKEVHNHLMRAQEKSAWMSAYNVRHNFSSPLRVRDLIATTSHLINDLTAMSKEGGQLMFDAFDEYTIAEFIEQTIHPALTSLRKHHDDGMRLLRCDTWPQRPLPIPQELMELILLPSD